MRSGLAAARAPGRSYGAPALAADGADDAMRLAIAQQGVAEQALRGKQKLLESEKVEHRNRMSKLTP